MANLMEEVQQKEDASEIGKRAATAKTQKSEGTKWAEILESKQSEIMKHVDYAAEAREKRREEGQNSSEEESSDSEDDEEEEDEEEGSEMESVAEEDAKEAKKGNKKKA